MHKPLLYFSILFALIFMCGVAVAKKSHKELVLAVSNATSGPASQLGTRLNQGSLVYFNKVNKQQLLPGYEVKLHRLDDSYEPFNTLQNTQQFVANKDVFALFNYVGTPTTHAIFPMLKRLKLPFLTPFTGAEFLRFPPSSNIFNLRASYFQEAKVQIEYLVQEKKISKIGLLIQADQFGYSVEQGYLDALNSYGLTPVVTTRYRRNTLDIETALQILLEQQVEAIAFVGTYQPFATLINKANQKGFRPFFTTVSFISSKDLFNRIKEPANVLVTEVFPDPMVCDFIYCQEFRKDMLAAGFSSTDRVQLEGYLNAYLFSKVAAKCIDNMTTDCYLEKIKKFNNNENDFPIAFSDKDHQGSNSVYLNFYQAR